MPISILGNDAYRFSVERMLADKMLAIYSKKRFRRPKDIYDFYIITNCFNVDMTLLRSEIDLRGSIDWDKSPIRQEISKEYKKVYDTLKLSNGSGSDIVLANKVYDYDTVLGRVGYFASNFYRDGIWVCSKHMFKDK